MAKMMKSSTLRCSLGSIQWSGLKLPFEPSPRGTWQAIFAGKSATSKVSMRLAPLSPLMRRCQVGSTPQASGVTMPSPVTTTRLIFGSLARSQYHILPPPRGRQGNLRSQKTVKGRRKWRRYLFGFFSRNLMGSPTVRMVSAASSGISQPNSSSNAMTSSTVSRLSAPRSSMKLAFSVTFSASTPKCSTTIFFTRSPISLIAATSCPLNWARSVSAPEPLRYGLAWYPPSDHRVIGSRADPYDDWHRYAAPAKPKLGYHTSNALTSMAAAPPAPRRGPQRQRSNHRHPAVHVQRLAGDVGGLLRGEKNRSRRHIRPYAEPARGHSGEDRLPLLVAELVGHRRG